jgi:hypothetical protein
MYLLAGKLKNTKRYQDAHTRLRNAKLKYGVNEAIISGDSLGGKISSFISIHLINFLLVHRVTLRLVLNSWLMQCLIQF